MSTIIPLPPVKPFAAVFAQDSGLIAEAIVALSGFLGEAADIVSPEFPVKETRYYEPEMGDSLKKVYASWPGPFTPDRLVVMKLFAMRYEDSRAVDTRRVVNLDPGYIFSGGLVLSTGKFRGHRLHIGEGLWGELTLHYHQGEFQPFPWTYQDYKVPEIQAYFIQMRKAFMAALRETGNTYIY